jgi:ribosomal protein S18 acetylase RimI-like enzyme
MIIRVAVTQDIDQLLGIEQRCFQTDRLSRRNFSYLLTKANAHTLLAETDGIIQGYIMVLFSQATSAARLYSIAVEASWRNQGVAQALLQGVEQYALERDTVSMRLEVRADNTASQQFFKKHGYKKFGVVADYYEDHEHALRFEKWLAPHLARELVRVPYYQQTLDFTCGPAALMMAMRALDPTLELNRKLELSLWREATTIFMTSGHGGCGPYGLALSAYQRGFDVDIYVNTQEILLVDSVRSQQKKEVIRLVQEDFLEKIATLPIQLTYSSLTSTALREYFEAGGIPLVLISSYQIYREKFPHWVVVTGFDQKYIYVHDPFVDDETEETVADCINIPLLQRDFEHMARYGKTAQKAALIIKLRQMN